VTVLCLRRFYLYIKFAYWCEKNTFVKYWVVVVFWIHFNIHMPCFNESGVQHHTLSTAFVFFILFNTFHYTHLSGLLDIRYHSEGLYKIFRKKVCSAFDFCCEAVTCLTEIIGQCSYLLYMYISKLIEKKSPIYRKGRRGRDHIVVRFTTTCTIDITIMARSARYQIMWCSLSVTCDRSVVFSGFFHQ